MQHWGSYALGYITQDIDGRLGLAGITRKDAVLAAGGVAAVVGGMQAHVGVAEVQQRGSFALWCIALGSDAGKGALLAAGGVAAVVGGVQVHVGVPLVRSGAASYWHCRGINGRCRTDAEREEEEQVLARSRTIWQGARRTAPSTSCVTAPFLDEASPLNPRNLGECPLCFEPTPVDHGKTNYMACCGQFICRKCLFKIEGCKVEGCKCSQQCMQWCCPFCRAPPPDGDAEHVARLRIRVGKGEAAAQFMLGTIYEAGACQLNKNPQAAAKLFRLAAELGLAVAQERLGR